MKTQQRRRLLGFCAALLFGGGLPSVMAQASQAVNAIPFYRPADLVNGLYRHWAPPRAAAFTDAAEELQSAVQSLCNADAGASAVDLKQVRLKWLQAVGAWERLAAVPFGPLIERRSVRQIDFTPTRPQLIERAIQRAPNSAADMERIGTPAKGFPALEWLLWTRAVEQARPACAYAVQVAADIRREVLALVAAYHARATKTLDDDAAAPAFAEFINQWVGALERLRWQQIERPVRERNTGGRSATIFPRLASSASADSWARQWAALRALAVADADVAPAPGTAPVSLETYLRGRGQNDLADRWRQRIASADAAMHDLQPGNDEKLLAAARELARLKHMAEDQIAPAIEVSIGFSDSDGD